MRIDDAQALARLAYRLELRNRRRTEPGAGIYLRHVAEGLSDLLAKRASAIEIPNPATHIAAPKIST